MDDSRFIICYTMLRYTIYTILCAIEYTILYYTILYYTIQYYTVYIVQHHMKNIQLIHTVTKRSGIYAAIYCKVDTYYAIHNII